MITAQELRKKYLEFFASKRHTIIPSASLIPENDPTVLFTTAGMHPLVPYLMGEKHPGGSRVANAQKCIRTTDIDEVGDSTHLTFFEMLGNWSFGDYFKKEAIEWSFEFLTSSAWLNIPLNRLAVSVFEGDATAPRDEESAGIWTSRGIPAARIAYLGRADNWWGPAGQTGPCGPDTEMFYWVSAEPVPDAFDPKDKRWVEIWNDVFMQYNKTADGAYEPLQQKNVDTGMGLERVLVALNGLSDVYASDVMAPIVDVITTIAGGHVTDTRALRIVADHIRAATFIIGDRRGVEPSNVDQGYIVRRCIRRAVRYAKTIGISEFFTARVATRVIELFRDAYPELHERQQTICNALQQEEEKFQRTLAHGLREFEKMFSETQTLSGEQAFILYSTFGFPLELSQELAKEKGQDVDTAVFRSEFEKHQALSRAGATQKFSGGLADHSWEVVRQHTATHLLDQALRDVLGNHVEQKGSNITKERLRFDFTHSQKMTDDEKSRVEEIVNQKIKEDLPVRFDMMTVDEAKAAGAIGLFEDKYATLGNKIKVYSIGEYSKEICGGPHVDHTGELGRFVIKKEEAVSAGIRRIKAILEGGEISA